MVASENELGRQRKPKKSERQARLDALKKASGQSSRSTRKGVSEGGVGEDLSKSTV